MLEILVNDWKRLLAEKQYLIVSLILTICSILAAVVLTNTAETKYNLAFVTGESLNLEKRAAEFEGNPYVNIFILDSKPPKSELVQNRFDAIVLMSEDGSFAIETIKGEGLRSIIKAFMENPDSFAPNTNNKRQIGTNIIGYMLMFLLLQGVLYARFFAEDKEKHMIERIISSPISFTAYLFGHALFMFLLILIPCSSVILAVKTMGITMGFSFLIFFGLIAMLAVLATGFSLMLNAFFCIADTANMLGSSLVLLTSILAGSFYSFSKDKTIFDQLIHILPQKDFMDFVNALEKGQLTNDIIWQFLYVGVVSVAFFVIAMLKTRKDYIYHSESFLTVKALKRTIKQ